jgi:hypothetical protein
MAVEMQPGSAGGISRGGYFADDQLAPEAKEGHYCENLLRHWGGKVRIRGTEKLGQLATMKMLCQLMCTAVMEEANYCSRIPPRVG